MKNCTFNYLHADLGFSLIEILVAISLMAIMTVAVAPQLKYLINFQAAADTQNRLSELQSGFSTAYLANMTQIETDPNAEINFGAAGIMSPATAAPGARCSVVAADFIPWSQYTGHAAGSLVEDGYGAPLCVLINPQSAVLLNGINLYYHTVAFVSTGPNNVLDNGTALDALGNLTLAGDDAGVLFDGRAFSVAKYTLTADKMKVVAQALEEYYVARYQSDPSRSSSIDYWSNGTNSPYPVRWDSSNPGNLINYTITASPIYTGTGQPTTDLSVALSLSKDDVTDGYGNLINFENASQNVRSPDNGSTNLAIPPYTALLSTTLPGNVPYAQAIVGVNN
ncbi:MAG TPA: type II secretion system protein [Burkholderiales bacterium]|nr:type II secretion system protein [Burkholderiales bacterium]